MRCDHIESRAQWPAFIASRDQSVRIWRRDQVVYQWKDTLGTEWLRDLPCLLFVGRTVWVENVQSRKHGQRICIKYQILKSALHLFLSISLNLLSSPCSNVDAIHGKTLSIGKFMPMPMPMSMLPVPINDANAPVNPTSKCSFKASVPIS